MLSRIKSGGILGIEGLVLSVEVFISPGLPQVSIIGQPDAAAREAKERVRSAIKNSGFDFPLRRVTINLAPANVKKEGPHFDLAIAAGILAASGQAPLHDTLSVVFMAELALDGTTRPVTGVLPVAWAASRQGIKRMLLHPDNRLEALSVPGMSVTTVSSLAETVREATLGFVDSPLPPLVTLETVDSHSDELGVDSISGLQHQKYGLTIAAAGRHHLLMVGPPGSGKTMLARGITSILPPLTPEEALEASIIHSVRGLLPKHSGLLSVPPFRAPHHTVSTAGMLGSARGLPGDVSLAHNGVLFLDELPEFRRDVLEALRQPLEDRTVNISRSGTRVSLPARFMLVAARNPCKCGALGRCTCTPIEITRYRNRISGPIRDRIDMQMEVPRQNWEEVLGQALTDSQADMALRVLRARAVQHKRNREIIGRQNVANGDLSLNEAMAACHLGSRETALFGSAFDRMRLSMRGAARVLRVARTIADVEESSSVTCDHLALALSYRVDEDTNQG